MRRALNIMFKNKKLAIAVPIFLAAGIYLLSLLPIEGEKQTELAAEVPILFGRMVFRRIFCHLYSSKK